MAPPPGKQALPTLLSKGIITWQQDQELQGSYMALYRPGVRGHSGAPPRSESMLGLGASRGWRHLLEFLLRLAPQVPHQPLGGEGVLGWHPPAHHSIEEGLALSRVEAQHLRAEGKVGSRGNPGVRAPSSPLDPERTQVSKPLLP